MKHLNCIVVFNSEKDKILFCKRKKDPYKGLYNFVGGKVEPEESSDHAAYRELREETGISKNDIELFRLMDLTYYVDNLVLEIYVGRLSKKVELTEEVNPLTWLPLTENFADSDRFAGEQDMAHIVNMAVKHPLRGCTPVNAYPFTLRDDTVSMGIDGCKGGWLAALLDHGALQLKKFTSLEPLTELSFDTCVIDMIIGLQGNVGQIRPDQAARKILKTRACTIFSSPCRNAVYGDTKEKRLQENMSVLGIKLTNQTDAIIPKIREVDEFLQIHREYQNKIVESHPEVSFARLNNGIPMTSKHDATGMIERAAVLSRFLPDVSYDWIAKSAKQLKCNADDIADSICLAIVANLMQQGKTETIPDKPMCDDTGLWMQMVIPKLLKI